MALSDRYAAAVTNYGRLVIVFMLVSTAVVGAGATNIDGGLTIASFGGDSTAAQKLDYIQQNFSTDGENVTTVQIVVRGDDVLSKESLISSLRVQQRLRTNETINATLRAEQPTVGLSNLVAIAAIRAEQQGGRNATVSGANGSNGQAAGGRNRDTAAGAPTVPTIDEQIVQLESMSVAEVNSTVAMLLDPDTQTGRTQVDPYALLSTEYEPGSTEATARIAFAFQQRTSAGDSLAPETVAAQLAIRDIVKEELGAESFVFGAGIVDEVSSRATGESFAVIGPIALAFILLVLLVVYRDLLDVLLALVGVVLVLFWMAGFMGWAGIGITQILIAVPFLLIGLAVDYAFHVVMRYREAQTGDEDRTPRRTMRVGLTGIVAALAATTFTTAIGFFSNLSSAFGSIREFGLVSGVGILATFLVFALLLPALKIELEALLERVGLNRRKTAFGTSGLIRRLLGSGATLARRIPVVIVVVALLISAGGGYAATEIDTSLDPVEFLPRDTPEWMEALPASFQPTEYELRENAIFLNENFARSTAASQVEILTEGSVTAPDTLERLATARESISETSSAITLANGRPSIDGPLSVLREVSERNGTLATVIEETDTDGNGVPDRNLARVYDTLYAVAPETAAGVIYRTDGDEYRALRQTVAVKGGAATATVTSEMRAIAEEIEDGSGLTVTATGQPIISELVQSQLLRTLVETFLITFGIILVFLTAIFYRRYGSLTLGALTVVPVVFALSWILGTMYLVGIPFNTETVIIASIAIGIGIDYAIHISERFVEELDGGGTTTDVLDRTLRGTGGALLASAVTTAGGFGVLMFALVPSLRRFGLVTGSTIVFAFVASVFVLPSLLVLWDRQVGYADAKSSQPSRELDDS